MAKLRSYIPPLSMVLFLAFTFMGAYYVRHRLVEFARRPSPEAEKALDRVIHELYAAHRAKPPQKPLSEDNGTVTRFEPDGRVRWRRPMGGYIDPWACVIHGGKVILPRGMGLVALDDRTGEACWTSDGPVFNLHATDNIVVATNNSGNPEWERDIVARGLRDGSVAWRAAEQDTRDPGSILQSGNLLFVRYGGGFENGPTTCVDLKGKVRFHLKEFVYSARETGPDVFVATNQRVAKLKNDGAAVWEASTERPPGSFPFDFGDFVMLPGGDILVFFYGPISDSGVEVWRVDAANGRVIWKTECQRLGIPHSEYEHRAWLVPLSREVIVVSNASGGSFVEVLALSDGKQLTRAVLPVRCPAY